MADTKISALPASTTPLAGTEVLPIVQSGTTKQVSVNNMLGVTSWTSPAVNSEGNMFLRATDSLAAGVGTQIGLGGKYNASSYFPFGAVAGRKENSTNNNVAGYLSLLTTTSGGTLTERWRVDSAGNFIPLAAAKGVNFTANTPAAGMTSQLLNWYEEGTWTPTQGAGLTVVGSFSSSGTYTRVGRQVTVIGYVAGSTSVAVTLNGVICGGLPFTVAGQLPLGVASDTGSQSTSCFGNPTTALVYVGNAITASPKIYFELTYFV